MAKHSFTAVERYAVFAVHGEKCYMCAVPLNLKTMEVDHIIPETLLAQPQQLTEVLKSLGRPDDFDLNGFENWLPACRPCNGAKRHTVFEPSLLVQGALQRAAGKARQAEELAATAVTDRRVSIALNVLQQVNETGALPEWAIEDMKLFVGFHTGHRTPDMVAEPIRLTATVTVYLEIRFSGGCLDKKVFRSGSPELDVEIARWLLLLVRSYIVNSEQEARETSGLLKWRQPVPELVELAKQRGWSQEERDKNMRYHVYLVTRYEQGDNTVIFNAEYRGIE